MSATDLAANLGLPDSFRILRGLLSNAGAALYGAKGQLLWAEGRWTPEETAAAVKKARDAERDSSETTWPLAGGRVLHLAPVPAHGADDVDCVFIVVCDGGAVHDAGDAINAMAAGIAAHRRLNAELDSMAGELSDRYEELNLIYATSNQTSRFTEGQAALDDLVESCRSHLDASFVALVLPAQGLFFERHDSRSPVQRVSEFLRTIAGRFFTDFARAARPLVLNEGTGAYAEHLQPFGAMKLAASPVLDSRGEVCGALLMVNPSGCADFSNSDKNLLSSIAETVAKIVQASYDALTGLLLKNEFERRLEAAYARSLRDGTEHCVLCIDLDQLAVINETLGHAAGDEMLRCVGRHLDQRQGGGRVAARIGSGSFGFLLENCAVEPAREFAEAIRLSTGRLSFAFDNHPIEIAASIGVAVMSQNAESAAAVLATAELASNAAREKGRHSVYVYQDGNTSIIKHNEQMRWVGRVHEALRSDRFRLYGQLIRPLRGNGESHVEVLLRLLDDGDRIQSPDTFLPAAERYFLMPSIDRWVVSHALQELARHKSGVAPVVSINLSGQSLNDDAFIGFIITELDRFRISGGQLCFEITETAAITSLETAKRFILRLKERGCRFSLDDFGTGLSSFSYLKALPVDFVKIDGSFVKGIIDDPVSESMVLAIAQVGHAMGLKIIAEYVETAHIERRLGELGVDFAQGYAIERPKPFRAHLMESGRMAVAEVS
ncbi:MAG: putative bifunctional diguanylate cyclase/phosphodiesterase [Gammaproteobacteria bacterium]